jgi:hypothetical protein
MKSLASLIAHQAQPCLSLTRMSVHAQGCKIIIRLTTGLIVKHLASVVAHRPPRRQIAGVLPQPLKAQRVFNDVPIALHICCCGYQRRQEHVRQVLQVWPLRACPDVSQRQSTEAVEE